MTTGSVDDIGPTLEAGTSVTMPTDRQGITNELLRAQVREFCQTSHNEASDAIAVRLLHTCAIRGLVNETGYLIRAGVNPCAATPDFNQTALHLAVANGNAECVADILDACIATTNTAQAASSGSSLFQVLQSTNSLGDTALDIACTRGDVYSVRLLLRFGALRSGHKGDKQMRNAVSHGHLNVLKELAINHVDLKQYVHEPKRVTAMHVAARRGFTSIVRFLEQETPESMQEQDIKGRTPLLCACYSGETETALTLIVLSADSVLNKPDIYGMTPLMVASHSGNFELAKALLKHYVHTEQVDQYGRTVIDLARTHAIRDLIERFRYIVFQGTNGGCSALANRTVFPGDFNIRELDDMDESDMVTAEYYAYEAVDKGRVGPVADIAHIAVEKLASVLSYGYEMLSGQSPAKMLALKKKTDGGSRAPQQQQQQQQQHSLPSVIIPSTYHHHHHNNVGGNSSVTNTTTLK
jgi:ankyrin repeat protein